MKKSIYLSIYLSIAFMGEVALGGGLPVPSLKQIAEVKSTATFGAGNFWKITDLASGCSVSDLAFYNGTENFTKDSVEVASGYIDDSGKYKVKFKIRDLPGVTRNASCQVGSTFYVSFVGEASSNNHRCLNSANYFNNLTSKLRSQEYMGYHVGGANEGSRLTIEGVNSLWTMHINNVSSSVSLHQPKVTKSTGRTISINQDKPSYTYYCMYEVTDGYGNTGAVSTSFTESIDLNY